MMEGFQSRKRGRVSDMSLYLSLVICLDMIQTSHVGHMSDLVSLKVRIDFPETALSQ